MASSGWPRAWRRSATPDRSGRAEAGGDEHELARLVGGGEVELGGDPPVTVALGVVEDLGDDPVVVGLLHAEQRRTSRLGARAQVVVLGPVAGGGGGPLLLGEPTVECRERGVAVQRDQLDTAEVARLYDATRAELTEWLARLRAETGDGFPEKVTAFREGMAVHGRYGQPCPVCGTKVQRIRYAANETNYCARCQTNGRLLADRAMSRLLLDDWPRSIDDLE